MKIKHVHASYHRVPAAAPLLKEPVIRDVVFTRVETDEGITGFGMAGPTLPTSVMEFINRELGPFLIGRDAFLTEQWWDEAYWKYNQRSLTGVVSCGLSGVDIALWDAKGKKLGQPVWKLLGGHSAKVPAYITFGLPEYNHDELAEVAKMHLANGHDKLKMVVALDPGGVREDAARVKTVREAIGEGIQLMIDANHLFSPMQAAQLCRLVEPYELTWFEEPIYGNDARKLAELRSKTSIAISAGQYEGHRWRHRELIVNDAIDIVQPNVLFVGGYTEAIKVAHLAQIFNLPLANGGGWPHLNAHLMAAVPNGWRVEFHQLMWSVGNLIYQHPPQPEAGWVTLSDAPGLDLDPKEDALREYEVEV